jgi:hypothetical protein
MAEKVPAPMKVSWDEIKDTASLAFNIWMGQPELAWAKKAWLVLTEAKLTTYKSEFERYEVLFRLLVLGGVYSDFCDAAWEQCSDPTYSYWAETLELDPFILGQLYAKLPESDSENEESASDALEVLVENQRACVVAVLMAAFGGVSGMYSSLWRSRLADGKEPEEDDTYDPEAAHKRPILGWTRVAPVIADVPIVTAQRLKKKDAHRCGSLGFFFVSRPRSYR